MLVLARRLSERILIGNDIEIIISDIRENNKGEMVVDLAFKAPRHIKILRHENYLKDLRKNGSTIRNQSQ